MAFFTTSHGTIEELEALPTIPPGAPAGVTFPHGMFSFKVTGLSSEQEVTITIELPGPVPIGTKWWKYQNSLWDWVDINSQNGNIITITLKDGGDGDFDDIPGQITDPGGPGYPISVPVPNVYDLIISSTEGGSVTTPGEGLFPYSERRVVKLVASPDAGYKFVDWIGDVDTVEDVNAATTKITMNGDYSVNATFATEEDPPGEPLVQYELTVSSTIGGSVTTPGEGLFNYDAGMSISLVASPDDGYKFVNWTGDGITHTDSATTIVTMNGDYSIKANFEFEQTTTDSAEGSSGPLACFIATAAYGTPMAEEIQILREFRDEYLLTNTIGQAFVDFYYRVSPPIAEFIAHHSSLKPIVRAGLLPAVAVSTVIVNTTAGEKMIIVALLVLVSMALTVWIIRQRRRHSEYI